MRPARMPAGRERRCLPVEAWPAADRAGWAAATATGDLLLDDGPVGHLRPSSREKLAMSYGRWLGWLASVGELDLAQDPAARATPGRVDAYLAALRVENAPRTVLGRIADLATMLRLLAPGHDLGRLRRIVARLRARVRDVRDKRARLRGAGELEALGHALMRRAETVAGASLRARARLYRDGLMIALLASRPLRLRNLVDLEFGRHVLRRGTGWWLEIPGAETKTGEPIDLPWPDGLAPALEAYLEVWRPRLARPERIARTPALWPTARGTALGSGCAYDRICARTREAFGRPVHPHLFRDAAATTVALADPARVGITRSLLGHRGLATAERHYNLARSAEAARAWHELREELARDRRRR